MKLPGKGTTVFVAGFIIFLVVFAYLLLTYTRRVDGVSMLPTLVEGDLVIVQGAQMSDVRVGDIIVYGSPCSNNGYSVIHRAVGVQGGGFLTKGDNNPNTDQILGIANSPVTQDCLEGKVIYVVPYVERLASLPYGTNYLLAVLIILAVLYSEVRGRGDEETQEKRRVEGRVLPGVSPGGQARAFPKARPVFVTLREMKKQVPTARPSRFPRIKCD